MSFLSRLLLPMQHCEDATARLLSTLEVKFTRTHLRNELLQHPGYPDMQAIVDVISTSYDIASLPLQIPRPYILLEPEVKPPYLAYIRTDEVGATYATVTRFSEHEVELYNPGSGKVETLTTAQFDALYLGMLLLVGKGDDPGEKQYVANRRKERRKAIAQRAGVFALPLLTLAACGLAAGSNPLPSAVFPVLFTILTLAGSMVAALLLWHEVDQHNPELRKVCQAGTKVNCGAILNTAAAKIGGQSWSSIGFAWFTGMLLALLVGGITHAPVLQLLAWANVLALPYTVFSIWYQWKVARQWCMLCLMVQGVLLLQFAAALGGGLHTAVPFHQIPPDVFISVISCFVFAAMAVFIAMPAFAKAKESRQRTVELQRLKLDPRMFEAILSKQKFLDNPPDGLGITLGKADADFRVLKVCNPYCGPCAKAHSDMEPLLDMDAVQLQIIFTASGDERDRKTPPVRHLLAIAEADREHLGRKALDDWYLAEEKDYDSFAKKYPMNGALQQQDGKIREMWDWCNAANITHTPTFFISMPAGNGSGRRFYQLPDIYTVNDIRYFITN